MKAKKTYIAKPGKKAETIKAVKQDGDGPPKHKKCSDCTNPQCKC